MSNRKLKKGKLIATADATPKISGDTFVADGAFIIGDVSIGDASSVWFGAILRGDEIPIIVGNRSNIQDGVIIHGDEGGQVLIGDDVTIGHRAVIHGCTIENTALIGMGAVLLDGVTVEAGGMVAAGAVVSPGKTVTTGSVWAGCPAKPMKDIPADQAKAHYMKSATHYVNQAANYRQLQS